MSLTKILSRGLGTGVGGKVLQVVSTTKTDTFSTSSTSYVDVTGFSVNITPSSASNKILVIADYKIAGTAGLTAVHTILAQVLSATTTYPYQGDSNGSATRASFGTYVNESSFKASTTLVTLLSPNTTSQLTYKVQIKAQSSNTVYFNRCQSIGSDQTVDASSITVIEIAG